MEHVDVQIILKNAGDITMVQRGIITEPEIRQTTVKAMVELQPRLKVEGSPLDTGATYLVINRELLHKLGLTTAGERTVSFANSAGTICKMTEPVEIHWEDRSSPCPPCW
jgi:predicted aspartyl protease